MRPMAFVGRKPCGCAVYARLCEYKARRPMPKLHIERVPVERANVTVCRCAE